MFWTKKLQDTYKRWYHLQKTPISSEAFYTSEQEPLIFQVCVTLNGTVYQYVASETNWVQEVFYSEQSQVQKSRPKRDSKPHVKLDPSVL